MVSKNMKAVQKYVWDMGEPMGIAVNGGRYLEGVEGELWNNLVEAWLAIRDYEGEG
jgi:hypothetical protein